MSINVKIYVTLKEGVLDPQGRAVVGALGALDFKGVEDLRIGKFMELKVDADSKEAAEDMARRMCEELLANPVIEDFRVEAE